MSLVGSNQQVILWWGFYILEQFFIIFPLVLLRMCVFFRKIVNEYLNFVFCFTSKILFIKIQEKGKKGKRKRKLHCRNPHKMLVFYETSIACNSLFGSHSSYVPGGCLSSPASPLPSGSFSYIFWSQNLQNHVW